ALLVGLETPDDAGVYQVAHDIALVQTVDFFTPIVDDPYAWGRIAAANALSDVYAMGGRPVTALNLVGWPRALDLELLGRVLDGGGDACAEAGVAIVGGHSVDDPEPKFGLAVTGVVDPKRVVRTKGAHPGCDLVLTKPLGMGIISSAIKEGRVSAATMEEATGIMATLNRAASEAMLAVGVAAATDVTGFGLIGHLVGMLGDELAAELHFRAIPFLPEALELAEAGVYAGGSKRNLEALSPRVDVDGLTDAQARILFDAQTSGGLLIAVDEASTSALLERLKGEGVESAARIGKFIAGDGHVRVTA
ncbi:MAG: selenide, water dikinase SelD, partial [Actinomycetota bacterium]